ncbi:hypothetical protein [Sedimenticola selenatireducens]|nr:hypothetical protein [Sedimenticola selenatireducens]
MNAAIKARYSGFFPETCFFVDCITFASWDTLVRPGTHGDGRLDTDIPLCLAQNSGGGRCGFLHKSSWR